jgi:hypothetical protein
MFYRYCVIKSGSPEDLERMMARMDAESSRPIDDPAPIRDFPKYGRPLVYVGGIYGKAVGWTHKYGLIEWLDSADNTTWVGLTPPASSEWNRTNGRAVRGCSRHSGPLARQQDTGLVLNGRTRPVPCLASGQAQ